MSFRHEYKYKLNFLEYQILSGRLSSVLARDENAGPGGDYTVRSLHFNLTDSDGRSFRIRCYNGDPESLKLETRRKSGELFEINSVDISQDELRTVLSGNIRWMARDSRPPVAELFRAVSGQNFRPHKIVEFIREPFVCPAGNVRITFDRCQRTGPFSLDFFSDPLTADDDLSVLMEIKYGDFIPDFLVKLVRIQHRKNPAAPRYAFSGSTADIRRAAD